MGNLGQKGAVPLLILIAVVGLIGFFAVSSLGSFKNSFFASLFPKPASQAATTTSISFSSYFGGSGFENTQDFTTDSQGNMYVCGWTTSTDFPTTTNAYQRTYKGGDEAFAAKFSPNGNLIWSTLVGGPGRDTCLAIKIDSQGNVYLGGVASPGAPIQAAPGTASVFQPTSQVTTQNPANGYIVKLKPDGSGLIWASFFGANDDTDGLRDLEIDSAGDVYVGTGYNAGGVYPSSIASAFVNSPAGKRDTVIAKIQADGSQVLWARYIGGSEDEGAQPSVRVDPTGNIYFNTGTFSPNMPTSPGAYDATFNGVQDGYVGKLSPDGRTLLYGTFIGGSANDKAGGKHNLAIDALGNAYVTGFTSSSDFPTTPGVFRRTYNSTQNPDTFVVKISTDGSKTGTAQLVASTYLEGGGEGVVIDNQNNVYIPGGTSLPSFPVTTDAFQSVRKGGSDAVLVKLANDFSRLEYATLFGGSGDDSFRGIGIDANGAIWTGGSTNSSDWPLVNEIKNIYGGGTADAPIVKFNFVALSPSPSPTPSPTPTPSGGGLGDVTANLENLGNPTKTKYADGTGCEYARNVWDLQSFNSRIYLGSGNSDNTGSPCGNAGPVGLWYLDASTSVFNKDLTDSSIPCVSCVDSEQIESFRTIDNTLYIPGHDPRNNGAPGMYRIENGAWKKIPTQFDLHNYDVYKFNNTLFAAGSSTTALSILVSSDNGASWQNASFKDYNGNTANVTARIYDLFEMGGSLYASSWLGIFSGAHLLWRFDSTINTFNQIDYTTSANMFPDQTAGDRRMEKALLFNGQTVYLGVVSASDHQWTPFGLYSASDVNNARRINLPNNSLARDILVNGSTIYVLTQTGTNPTVVNYVFSSTDLITWSEVLHFSSDTFARSFEYLNGDFYFGMGTEVSPLSNTSGNILRFKTGATTPSPSPNPLPGDIIVNGRVDIFDYNQLLTDFGKTGSGLISDIVKNDRVDIFDYNLLLSNFGKHIP